MENSTMEECSDKNNVNLTVTDSSNLIFKANFYRTLVEYDEQHQGSHRKAWTAERILEVINDIKKAQVAMSSGQRRTAMDYYWMGKYDIMTTANEDCLIFKRLSATAPTIRILPREQYFDILLDVHKSCGHGGRDKIMHGLKNRYYIPKKAVEILVALCPICETKKNTPRKDIVTKPIVLSNFNSRGQVDLIDFQSCPDGEFEWLLYYQDNATKFLNLRPLKTKRPVEVASELMKIFLIFGAPYILQSENGHEFIANVIKEIVAMWPECKIVHENPPCPQTQGSVERSNQDVENMLQSWMNENKSTNWSVGCFFVQYLKNSSFYHKIGRSPYKALFGSEPKVACNISDIPTSQLLTIKTEEQLNTLTERESDEASGSNCDNKGNNMKVKEEENIENFESNFPCPVCHNDATGAYKCEHCNNVIHATSGITVGEEGYGYKVVCIICQVEQYINLKRDEAHKRSKVVCVMCQVKQDINLETDGPHKELKRVAEKMIDSTVQKMPKLDIGNSVLVSIPKVDREPLDMKNIQGKIVDIRNGVHRVGTKHGTIKNWFSRQALKYSDTEYGDEISETFISLKEAVASQSTFDSQEVQKCNCKPAVNQCRNNRCACFKNKVPCGSKCHGSLTCIN